MKKKVVSRLQKKAIDSRSQNGYMVFDIKQDLGLGADFGDLTSLMREALASGQKKIALKFTPDSYLYTPTLASLVNFYKMVEEAGGTLCLIEPNESIMEVLEVMGLAKVVEMAPTERQVGTDSPR